jgi:hypothetical protein
LIDELATARGRSLVARVFDWRLLARVFDWRLLARVFGL